MDLKVFRPLNFCDIPTRRRLPSLKEQGCHPNSMWTRCDSHPCFSGARGTPRQEWFCWQHDHCISLGVCTHCVPFSSPTIKISPELHEWLHHISRAFSSWPPQWHTQNHIRSKRPRFQGDSTCYTSKFVSDALKLVAYWLATLVTVFPFFLLVSSASWIQVSVQSNFLLVSYGFPWFPTFPGRLGWSEATVMLTITSTIPLPPTFSHFQCFFLTYSCTTNVLSIHSYNISS